jgi:hypothetical protein
MTCSAQQQGDEMACGRCGLRWGVADVDRPQCLRLERRQRPRATGGPVLPPGGFVVPERRKDPEERACFEQLARSVDFRGLLVKYMRHMRGEEGSTGAAWIGSDGRGYFSGVAFSPAEVAALKVCSDDAEDGV